jgi:putative holliday junction resolvase
MPTPATPGQGRILALDVGSKRIGVAVTDRWASPRRAWTRSSARISAAIWRPWDNCWTKYEVREIVVGLPLRLSGAEGTQSEKMRRFADDLHAHFGVTVHLWDERWTSTEANRLLRETDLSIKKRGQAVDRMAAILILQSWMEAQKNR